MDETEGVSHGEIQMRRIARSFRLFVPPSLDRSKPAPLVVVLHGGFGNGDGAAVQTGFDAQAAAAGFVTLYPDGVRRAWNAGGCCGPPARLGVDDVGFVSAAIDHVESQHRIDPARVYVTGISNGGMMAYRLASESGDRFAAVGAVSAAQVTDCPAGPPVSVLHIHGTGDRNVPYGGGMGTRGVTRYDYPPVAETLAAWRERNACRPDAHSQASGGVTVERWTGGTAGTEVDLYTIEGGGHSWPGGRRMSNILDPPSRALDATATIWEFFDAHPKPG